jgi:group II intron reverse transcriptase/maturase
MKSKEVYTKQQRIAELAKLHPQLSFTSLAYHIDTEWLAEAYRLTRKDGASGIDEQSVREYGENLEVNLESLLNRFKSGSYVASPVRRAYIPKNEKEVRPIGIPTAEDKILQRALVMLLSPIYEQDFLDCSYGFRLGRGVHTALQALWKTIESTNECWVIEVDIRGYFDAINHQYLREFLGKRVNDGVVRRIIGKWLKAGVMEQGTVHYDGEGTPQGGVISPLLSNIYLHEILDRWFYDEIRPRVRARTELIRFADDFVIVVDNEQEARRIENVLYKRFEKYGLTLHAEKTRVVRFNRPRNDDDRPESFTFLGFTHHWGKSRYGKWIVKRRTAKKKLKIAVRKVFQYCKKERHAPLEKQWKALCRTVRGHYAFYGITNNYRCINMYRRAVERAWRYWLSRRSRKYEMTWERFKKILVKYPIPKPRIVHSYLAKS